MGTLRLRFIADVKSKLRKAVLEGLRKLKAKTKILPLRSASKAGEYEEWVFETAPLTIRIRKPFRAKKPPKPKPFDAKAFAAAHRRSLWAAQERAVQLEDAWDRGPVLELEMLDNWNAAVESWNGGAFVDAQRIVRAREIGMALAVGRACSTVR